MAKVTVQYEFDFHEDQEELKILTSHRDMYCTLVEIDQEMRSRLKWGSDKETEEHFLERMRMEIAQVVNL